MLLFYYLVSRSGSTEWITKEKPDINSVEVHPQLSCNWMVHWQVLVQSGQLKGTIRPNNC
jgi:hypothetical protein